MPVRRMAVGTPVAVGTVLCSAWNMQLHCTLPQSTRGANTAPAPAPALSTDDETPAGNGGVVPSTGSGSNAEVGSSSSSGGGSSSNGDSSSSADSSSSSSGGNGTPGWVWAIVGVAVALAMTASLAVWLRRQRRTRKRLQQQQLVGVKLVDPAELPSEPSQSTTRPGSDMGSGKMGSMGLPSPGTSGFLDRQQSNVPDGAFKSRLACWLAPWPVRFPVFAGIHVCLLPAGWASSTACNWVRSLAAVAMRVFTKVCCPCR